MKHTLIFSVIFCFTFSVIATGQSTGTSIDSMKLFQMAGSSDSIMIEDAKYYYDPYGNCKDYYIDYYDSDSGEWYRTFTEFNTFDKYQKLLSSGSLGIYPDKNLGSKTDYLFDENGKATGWIQYFWDKDANDWYILFRDAFTLNSFSERDTSYRYHYDPTIEEWSLFSIWIFLYDEHLDNVEQIQYRPKEDTSDWVPYLRKQYSYDSDHREILYESNYWDSISNAWLKETKRESEYDSLGNKTMWEIHTWNNDSQQWNESSLNIQNFDALGNLIYMEYLTWDKLSGSYETFVSLKWEFSDTDLYKEEIYQKLNPSSGIYENVTRTEYYFDSRGTEVFQRIFSWDTSSESWDLIQKRYLYHSYLSKSNETICQGKYILWEGEHYSEEGAYTKSYQAEDGRDSILLLNLFVLPAPASVNVTGDTAVNEHQQYTYTVPPQEDISYGWIVENGTILSEPDSSGIDVRWGFDGEGALGNYLIDENGCSSDTTSLEILILNTMVKDAPSDLPCKVYPNPTSHQLFIEFENTDQEIYRLMIYNNQGEKLHQIRQIKGEQIHIDVSKYDCGIYLFNLQKEGEQEGLQGKFVVL